MARKDEEKKQGKDQTPSPAPASDASGQTEAKANTEGDKVGKDGYQRFESIKVGENFVFNKEKWVRVERDKAGHNVKNLETMVGGHIHANQVVNDGAK